MSPATRQFAKVLGLFFLQGQLIWLTSFLGGQDLEGPWILAIFGAIVAWWPLWFALHRERTWQPWIETLLLMGATFWVPVFCDHWLRPLMGDGEPYFIPPEVALYLILFYAVLFTPIVSLAWTLVRWVTTWHWQSPHASKVSLRGFFLLSAAAALHLMAFLPMIKDVVESDRFSMGSMDLSQMLYFSLYVSALLIGLSLVVFGMGCLIAGQQMLYVGVMSVMLGVVAIALTTGWNKISYDEQFVRNLAIAVAMIMLQGAVTALALRLFGYRLVSGRAVRRREVLAQATASLDKAVAVKHD